ncbi:MAG: DUF2177 family protein [Bosea sp. (in: a-proteobacteria)]
MMLFLVATLAVALVLFPLDMVWLGKAATSIYKRELGSLMLERPRIVPAAVFYLSFVAGIAFFVVIPNLPGSSVMAALHGVAFGFVVYGAYDAVNRATLKDFTQRLMLIDWAWGTSLTAVSAGAAHWLVQRFWL